MIIYDPYFEIFSAYKHGLITFDELIVQVNNRGEQERVDFKRRLDAQIAQKTEEVSRKRPVFGVSL